MRTAAGHPAIVNRTPDSFFDRGATFELSAAVERVGDAVLVVVGRIEDLAGTGVVAGGGAADEQGEEGDGTHFGVGLGTLVLVANATLLFWMLRKDADHSVRYVRLRKL